MITVKVVGDSINSQGTRLFSALCTYPRFIHAEVMTHRTHSRNAASSRAIPFSRMAEMVDDVPAMPEVWALEKKGMQSGDQLSDTGKAAAEAACIKALGFCLSATNHMHQLLGVHKGIVNRYLEPWAHITTLLTATEAGWKNFFAQRAHPDADKTFQVLAYRLLHAYLYSLPELKQHGEWHIPYFGGEQTDHIPIAVARCARLSYLTHDGTQSKEADEALFARLQINKHWSPFEHCAQSTSDGDQYYTSNFDVGGRSGWEQYRKMFGDELARPTNLDAIYINKPEWIII